MSASTDTYELRPYVCSTLITTSVPAMIYVIAIRCDLERVSSTDQSSRTWLSNARYGCAGCTHYPLQKATNRVCGQHWGQGSMICLTVRHTLITPSHAGAQPCRPNRPVSRHVGSLPLSFVSHLCCKGRSDRRWNRGGGSLDSSAFLHALLGTERLGQSVACWETCRTSPPLADNKALRA